MKHIVRTLAAALLCTGLSVSTPLSAAPTPTQTAPDDNRIRIYPNPIVDKGYVDYQLAPSVREAKLMVYNVLGHLVREVELPRNGRQVELPVSQLRSGVYFYALYADGVKQDTKRLVVK